MAVKSRSRSSVWKLLQFTVRFLGLNGLIAAAVGAVLWQALGYEEAGLIVIIAGGTAVALALLAEVRGLVGAVASHRGAAGANVFLQVALASALVIGGNVYSFSKYQRYDCTRDRIFTLDDKLQKELAQLRGETDIIVYLQHVSFGQRVDLRQDEYDQAAEKIIIERVKDLVEQFQEFSPRFRVHFLDTQKKSFSERVKEVKTAFGANNGATPEEKRLAKRRAEEMFEIVKKAPEDSIFFYSHETKNLQRLSFSDIYQLDKKASEEANDKQGNLVLIDQGVQNFAAKIFKIEEKKPRVGFAVVHEVLGQDGREDIGMPGLKAALPTRDFEGRDIVLWKRLLVEPGALEHDESRFEILETNKGIFERRIKELEDDLQAYRTEQKYWQAASVEELNEKFVLVRNQYGQWMHDSRKEVEDEIKATRQPLSMQPITKEYKAKELEEWIEIIDEQESEIVLKKERLGKTIAEKANLRVENLAEQRRMTDVRGKFNRLLADIDLLVLPRATFFNLLRGDRIPSRFYSVDDAHVEAIKDFIKSGKPVLFCLGPMHTSPEIREDTPANGSIEKLLASFEIQLPNQTILFGAEGEAMEENRERMGPPGGAQVEIPAALFDWKKSSGARFLGAADGTSLLPIRTSMQLTARGLGDKSSEGLKIRHPRPVYVVRTSWSAETVAGSIASLTLPWPAGSSQALADYFSKVNKKFDEKSVFLMTDSDCWNEEMPIPMRGYAPRFKRPKRTNRDKGTVEERRHGPFPIGVALEADVPAEWYEKDATQTPKKVRLAVIGHGGIFVGEKLSPMREKLFLDVSNWLLRRDNLLAKEQSEPWKYPRVALEPEVKNLWEWIMRAALPMFFICLGANVWLVRRMR